MAASSSDTNEHGMATNTEDNTEPAERLTEELLARPLASKSVETYLEDTELLDGTLPDYLFELLNKRGLKRADVMRGSELNGTVAADGAHLIDLGIARTRNAEATHDTTQLGT